LVESSLRFHRHKIQQQDKDGRSSGCGGSGPKFTPSWRRRARYGRSSSPL